MRWLAGLVVVLAAIAGALYGVGYFLLSNTLEVTRQTTINRPRAAIFAQVNDLRIVKEWSPFYARDPGAEYTFSSDTPGQDQSMRWSGADRQVGKGELTIVRSTPPHGVETVLRIGGRVSLNADIQLSNPTNDSHVTAVSWRVRAGCSEGAVNIPCRYMNLVLQRAIERDLDIGLARLKTMSEQLLDVDFEGLTPEFETLAPQSFLYSPVSISRGRINNPADFEREVIRATEQGRLEAEEALIQNALQRAGPLLRVTTQFNDERVAYRIGYPFIGPAPLALTGEEVGETPSGRVMRVRHDGPRSELRHTYARAYAYLQAHHVQLRGEGFPWEVVLSDPADPTAADAHVRIEIYYPIQ
ncbi:MAG: GyrI-like domain-containing protein [Hyphomonadaceae bacterium]